VSLHILSRDQPLAALPWTEAPITQQFKRCQILTALVQQSDVFDSQVVSGSHELRMLIRNASRSAGEASTALFFNWSHSYSSRASLRFA